MIELYDPSAGTKAKLFLNSIEIDIRNVFWAIYQTVLRILGL